MTLADHLIKYLPPHAAQWCVMLYEALQVFDDVHDGDPVTKDDLHSVIWFTLVAMPQNPFYAQHSKELSGVVAALIMKWHAANACEDAREADAKSFVWRAGYFDVVLLCATLAHGPVFAKQNAESILRLYGEDLDTYLGEFNA